MRWWRGWRRMRWWRRRGRRRCGLRRGCRWLCRRCLRLWLSVGTKLFLGLGDHHRCGLRVRRRDCEVHCRKRGGGKQCETKSCHDGLGPREKFRQQGWQQGRAINEQALGRIVAAFKAGLLFISEHENSYCVFVHCAFRGSFQTELLHCPLRHIRYARIQFSPSPGKSSISASAAGEGVDGAGGARTGNSSGTRPGNSSGLGASPGSCIGGGTSGRGWPGGLSCGGSDGRPGLIGGSSCGSIGILFFPKISIRCLNGAAATRFRRPGSLHSGA
jgi:hypothetical protein